MHRGHVSDEYTPEEGIPQGGILSCLLWNFFFADLPVQYDDDVLNAAYADDLAVVVSASSLHEANVRMSRMYAKMREWAVWNRVEFNDKKVKSMVVKPKGYRRKRKRTKLGYNLDHVIYCDSMSRVIKRVDVVSQYRYLGMILDDKLTLKKWIAAIVTNANASNQHGSTSRQN